MAKSTRATSAGRASRGGRLMQTLRRSLGTAGPPTRDCAGSASVESAAASRLLQRTVVMSAIIAAVRQIARGLSRRAEERFCLIYELRLADVNGFVFLPSPELTENDVVNTLTAAGYDLREALRLIMDARLFFKSR